MAFEVDPAELQSHLQVEGRNGELVPLEEVLEAYRRGPAEDQVEDLVEPVRQELREEADKRFNQLSELTQRLITVVNMEGEIDPRLRETNPAEYIQRTEQMNARRTAIDTALAEMRREAEARQQEDAAKQEKWAREQAQVVYRNHPEWKDPETGHAAMRQIETYAKSLGFSKDEVNGVQDARMIEVLWDAAQHRAMQQKTEKAKNVLRGIPRKNLRASARNETAPQEAQNKQRQEQMSRFQSSGDIKDALPFFEELVD